MSAWRYGCPAELERDSLADRLIHDDALRTIITVGLAEGDGPNGRAAHEFRRRICKLAEARGVPYAEQLANVIERAIEHVQEGL